MASLPLLFCLAGRSPEIAVSAGQAPSGKAIHNPCHLALPLVAPSTLELPISQQETPHHCRLWLRHTKNTFCKQSKASQGLRHCALANTPERLKKNCVSKKHRSKMFHSRNTWLQTLLNWISELLSHILSLSVCWLQTGRCDTSTSLLWVWLWFLCVWGHSTWKVFSASDGSDSTINGSKF